MRVETIKWQTRAAYGYLVAGQSLSVRVWTAAYRLYARNHCCSCSMRLVALYKCYMPLPLRKHTHYMTRVNGSAVGVWRNRRSAPPCGP